MHRIFILLAAACLAVALPAQNSPRGPVTKNPNTHELTEDLVVPSARTLTVNGTFTWGTGASFSGAAAFRTAAGVQALDADLSAIAALTTTPAGRSLLTLSAVPSGALVGTSDTQTLTAKTISGASNTLTAIPNSALTASGMTLGGNAVSLGGTLSVDQLDGGLASNGIVVRTAANTRTARTITGTAGQITVTNGDGVSGNPTLSLPATLTQATTFSAAVPSTSTTTGAVVVSNGGLGVAGAIYAQAPPAGENSDRVPTSAWLNSRSIFGDVTRTVAPYMLSDGATANRAGVATLNAATNPARDTIQFWGLVTVPTSNTSDVLLFYLGPAAGSSVTDNESLVGFFNASGHFAIRYNGTEWNLKYRRFTDFTFRATYGGLTIPLSVTIYGDSATNPVVSANGADISGRFTPESAGSPAPNWLPSTLAATRYATGANWPAGRAPAMEWGFGAWSAAEVATWAQTGAIPSWCASVAGSATNQVAASWFNNPNTSFDFDTLTGASTAGFSATLASGVAYAFGPPTGLQRLEAGTRIRWRGVYNRTAGSGNVMLQLIQDNSTPSASVTLTASGAFDVVLTLPSVKVSGNYCVTTSGASGLAFTLSDMAVEVLGPAARWAMQPNCAVAPDSTTNGLPLLLTPGMVAVGDLPDHVVVQANPMTADGFVLADQVLTDSRYELVGCNVRQTGTATSTITVRETSSGGTTVATGALSSSTPRVGLTVSNGLLAGGKRLHLTNSSWGGNTVTPFFIFRRSQMP